VKHKLAWNQPVDSIPFDPVLVLLAEVGDICILDVSDFINLYSQTDVEWRIVMD